MTKGSQSNETPTDAARARQIRGWIDGKLKRLAGRGVLGGLGSTLLALPALAQATSEQLEEFQFASAIPGVKGVKLLSNGDVQLTMIDGRTLIVSAEDVEILDSGAIMIADDIAAQFAHFAVVGEAGAAAAAGTTAAGTAATGAAAAGTAAAGTAAAAVGGIGATGLALGGLGLAGAAAAVASAGSGDDDDRQTVDLPDLNLAGLQSGAISNTSTNYTAPEGTTSVEVTIGEVTKTTTLDDEGAWSVSLTEEEALALDQGPEDVTIRSLGESGQELASKTVKFDVETEVPTISINEQVINSAEKGTGLTISGVSNAENGQEVTVTFNEKEYKGTVSDGEWSVTVESSDLTDLTHDASLTVTANVSDAAGNPAEAAERTFTTDFEAPNISIDTIAGGQIEAADIAQDLILTGDTNAEDGQQVTATFNGQNYTGTVSGGEWSVTISSENLTGLTTGTPVSVSASVSDENGNPATAETQSVAVNLDVPSIAITPLSIGAFLNADDVTQVLEVSGTTGNIEDGQTVTLVLGNETYGPEVTDNAWSFEISAADLAALTDGSVTLTANVSDSEGNAATEATVAITKDVLAPTLTIATNINGDVLNLAEREADLEISGTTNAEDGQRVTVVLNENNYSGIVSEGAWSATVPATVLAELEDGQSFTVTANVSDAAGNEAYVRPKDIAFLHAGQSVKVKITAYDFSRYGSLDGEIIRIGADTITRSERSEEEVFVVEIRTSSTILDAGGEAVEIIPGMIAEVDILSGQKTVLDYLIQPVLKVKESAFRE